MTTGRTVTFGDLVQGISAGVSLHGENRLPRLGEVGILTLSAVLGPRLDLAACKAVSPELTQRLGPSIRAGTILMSRSNTPNLVGSCVYVEESAADRYLPDLIWEIALRADMSCDGRWLTEYLRGPEGRRMLVRAAAGTSKTMVKLSMSRLRRIKIPLPTLAAQRRAVYLNERLSRLSEALTSLGIAKRALKRGLMQQLLDGGRRFPEFKRRPWIEVCLGEVFAERNEVNWPDLPLLSVTSDRGLILRHELDKRDTSNPDKSRYKRVLPGDIAYNTMRMWQGVSALSSLEGIVSPAYTVAITTDRIHGPFMKHLFKSPPVVHLFFRYSQGLVDDTLNLKFDRFSKIKVRIPSDLEEQSRIASVLDLCDEEIQLLEVLARETEEQKLALMSRLVSGEISVPA